MQPDSTQTGLARQTANMAQRHRCRQYASVARHSIYTSGEQSDERTPWEDYAPAARFRSSGQGKHSHEQQPLCNIYDGTSYDSPLSYIWGATWSMNTNGFIVVWTIIANASCCAASVGPRGVQSSGSLNRNIPATQDTHNATIVQCHMPLFWCPSEKIDGVKRVRPFKRLFRPCP